MRRKKNMENRAEHIRTYFHSRSLSMLASELGVARMTVSRIAVSLGLTRSREDMRRLNVEQRVNLVKRERRRLIFGLEPVSEIKVVSNRRKITLRYRLKKKGYVPGEEINVMYYPDELVRSRNQEIYGEAMGLRFYPLPV